MDKPENVANRFGLPHLHQQMVVIGQHNPSMYFNTASIQLFKEHAYYLLASLSIADIVFMLITRGSQ